jgi:hypothetical protein
MAVTVVRVGSVRVVVRARVVPMRVAVLTVNHLARVVIVMTIVVPMRVLVLDGFVRVQVLMRLGEVQINTNSEERGGGPRRRPERAVSQRPCGRSPDKRSESEDRARPRGAYLPLC